jgi:hypothetical protein
MVGLEVNCMKKLSRLDDFWNPIKLSHEIVLPEYQQEVNIESRDRVTSRLTTWSAIQDPPGEQHLNIKDEAARYNASHFVWQGGDPFDHLDPKRQV